ncbi:MAG TPA: geranylgeranyl reductase family protein, partial [Halanaerobiales bacterium]|nr:geranylgeranyl reductase family protein [Halanaerobiales bacterium]
MNAGVIIIGAGPAGSWLAYKLAKNDIDVLLLEKESWPRYKPCGGAVSGKTIKLLKKHGVILPDEIIEKVINNFNFRFNYQSPVKFNYTKRGIALVDRTNFDDYLLKLALKAGARFKSEEELIDIKITQNGAIVITDKARYNCEIVAGADGASSKTAHLLGLLPDDILNNRGMAVEMEINDIKDISSTLIDNQEILIDFGFIPGGYAWVFPKNEHFSIGMGTLTGERVDFKDKLRKYLSKLNISHKSNSFYRGHPIPFYGKTAGKIRVGGERFLLLGDAAHFADPLVGEGIYYACLSAELAADTIMEAFRSGNSNLSLYQDKVRKELSGRFKIIQKMADIFYNKLDYFKLLVSLKPDIIQLFLDVVQGEYSYDRL